MGMNTHEVTSNKVMKILDAVGSQTAGSTHSMPAAKVTIQIEGISDATVKFQVSNDNSNWIDVITTTADGGWSFDEPWRYIRGNVTVYSAGTINMYIGY